MALRGVLAVLFYDDEEEPGHLLGDLGEHMLLLLDGIAAVLKVSILLCLKMLVLPVLLGFGLDLATLGVFGASFAQRVQFATHNVLGCLLVHWVLGISFMLVITVSVLQLREVLHPHVLARIIRPQEAHPDLLMTLLEESCTKHARASETRARCPPGR